ncbi:MAG: VOC family protein [Gammaproteobacteria bacterium]|nr:MAG: VOC family protein [Gammaproteobacteria bacterium]
MIEITGLAHIGLRVMDFKRSVNFYRELGFRVIRDDPDEHIMVVKHPNGIEINLLDSVNANNHERNVLMDEPVRYAGYTHLALQVTNVYQTAKAIRLLGMQITEGPVTFGDGSTSIFIRDPDRNVIEFSQPHTHAVNKQHGEREQ